MFALDERVGFLRDALTDLPNVEVDVFSRARRRLRPQVEREGDRQGPPGDLGLRVGVPDEPAEPHLAPEIETVYVMASPAVSFVSSSGVKEIAAFGGKVDELVPAAVARRFRSFSRRTVRPRRTA